MTRGFLNRYDEGARLAARLVGCLPAATFEMETLVRLAGVVASRKILTAAVECIYRPRLLINPDFVGKYCQRDEHLFLLVMHELWHVLLAHTRLYPRMTPAHNVAFDAIINSGLLRRFHQPEYQGFFDTINPVDKFPHLLLRPPLGWPHDPQYPDDVGPPGTQAMLKRLYPLGNISKSPPPFYEEILDLLRQGGIFDYVTVVLLGDHSDSESDQRAMGNAFFREVMRRTVSAWPTNAFLPKTRGTGGSREDWLMEIGPSTEDARRAFAQILRRCLGPKMGGQRRRSRMPIPGITGMGVLPNSRDRLAPARQQLGGPKTLYNQQGMVKARVPERPSKAHVYLDVSGSMEELLPNLLGLLLPYVVNGHADVFQFSTIVEGLTAADLRAGKLDTSGGTDINPVLEHVFQAQPQVHRALVLTDGYTGAPLVDLMQRAQSEDLRVHVVLPAESPYRDDLQDLATSFTILPPLRPMRSPWDFGS